MTQSLSDAASVKPRARRTRRNITLIVGLSLVGLLIFAALFAPLLAPFDPNAQEMAARLMPPLPATGLALMALAATCSPG